jgi:hypothetical protein
VRRQPLFLSVVCVVRNAATELEDALGRIGSTVADLVNDYEIVVVDNASDDDTIATLRDLVGEGGLPNVQVYALTKEIGRDAASWMGLENSLGDYVVVLDPLLDDVTVVPAMLEKALGGTDVVFATNVSPEKGSRGYRLARGAFEGLYRGFTGVRLSKEAPSYRLVSRKVVNHVLHHPRPAVSYRLLPATGGFVRDYVTFSRSLSPRQRRSVVDGFDRGMQIMVSTSRAPLRAVTALSLFGAVANVVYVVYVLAIGLVKQDVEPGWISVSLQQSGMFFLLSLVLLVLGEYILHMAALNNEAPDYHLAQEFTSARISSRERLNVESVVNSASPDADE